MSHDLVSVVIPCYRQGHLLSDAIGSALAQDYPRVEVLVVNDGSDDATGEIAARFRGRIHYLEQANRGLSAARNTGILASSGRYLLFLDADDLLHPSAVGWLVDAMSRRDDRLALMGFQSFSTEPQVSDGVGGLPSNAAAYFRKTFEIDPLLKISPRSASDRLDPLPFLLYTNFGPPHCWLCSREMIIDLDRFDESLTSCEDWDLWLRLSFAGANLSVVEKVGAFYRRSGESMSRNTRRMIENRTLVLFKAIAALRDDPDRRRALGIHLYQAARRLRRRFVAHGIRSPLVGELSRKLDQLARPAWSGSRSHWWRHQPTRPLGAGWDRAALAYYARSRPSLVEYYLSETN